jgi:response regulator RpfG family c-di-GMP phosphodiesterase
MIEENRNILFIDDEPNVLTSLERLLRKENYRIFTARSGEDGIEIMNSNTIAVAISDLMMPGMNGLTFFEHIAPDHEKTVKILLTGKASIETALEAINRHRLFGYLVKPCSDIEMKTILKRAVAYYNLTVENAYYQALIARKNKALSEQNERLEKMVRTRTRQIDDALKEGIMMLATAAEEKDKDTGDHILRIRSFTQLICQGLNLTPSMCETVGLFSAIHDVGKIHIPDKILNKPGSLNEKEWEIMKGHTLAGEKILGKKKYYTIARQIARSHHENWDGSGYPDGLKGKDIPLPARIVSVADVYDALTSKRPYKEAWPGDAAVEELKRLEGRKFDPDVLSVFLELYRKGDVERLQGLNNTDELP